MILLIDKPSGYTSFDIVRKIKRLYHGEKVGHAGTLDPLATGLLIVAVGKDTKKLGSLTGLDKTYLTTIDLSRITDTRDSDFRKHSLQYEYTSTYLIVDGKKIAAPSQKVLQEKLSSIIGTTPLPLTPFSAKKVRGKKLYEYAREGNPIYLDVPMSVLKAEVLDYSFPFLTLHLHVGSGTYIRSIAHRLGRQFHLGGTVISLRRITTGPYQVP